jgi:hypothetical protein
MTATSVPAIAASPPQTADHGKGTKTTRRRGGKIRRAVRACAMNRPDETAQQRTLGRAVEIAGGMGMLARFLGCREEDVLHWHIGQREMPLKIFLTLVDVVAANALVPQARRNLE